MGCERRPGYAASRRDWNDEPFSAGRGDGRGRVPTPVTPASSGQSKLGRRL